MAVFDLSFSFSANVLMTKLLIRCLSDWFLLPAKLDRSFDAGAAGGVGDMAGLRFDNGDDVSEMISEFGSEVDNVVVVVVVVFGQLFSHKFSKFKSNSAGK